MNVLLRIIDFLILSREDREKQRYLADCLDETARQEGYRDPNYVWKNRLEVKRDKHNMPVRKK